MMNTIETYDSVWDAIFDTPAQAANMETRADLMRKIIAIVKAKGWTQLEAAKQCGVTQLCIDDLLRGRVSKFPLDALVSIATMIGQCVHVELKTVFPSLHVTQPPTR